LLKSYLHALRQQRMVYFAESFNSKSKSKSKVKVKVALLSITLHVKTYKGIDKNVSHSPTVKHIKCTGTTTDKTRHFLHIDIKKKHTDTVNSCYKYYIYKYYKYY